MPCRDYMDNFPSQAALDTIAALRDRNDMLARIACRALEELENAKDGSLEALVLKDEETRIWWAEHKEADRKRRLAEEKRLKQEREKARLAKIKEDTLRTLTKEQIKALGIKV